MVRQFRETLPMGNTALAMPLVALPKHPTWLLSRWGISTHQLSALLLAAAKLEQQVTGPRSLAEPPEPWTGSAEQKQVRLGRDITTRLAAASKHAQDTVNYQ